MEIAQRTVASVEALRLYRLPSPCVEVASNGRVKGRFFRVERRRSYLVIDDSNCEAHVCDSEESALARLEGESEPVLSRSLIDILAVGAERADAPGQTLCVGYVIDQGLMGSPSFMTLGMSEAVSAFPSEAEAVMSLIPELLWRSGWLEGEYPNLKSRDARAIMDALPILLKEA